MTPPRIRGLLDKLERAVRLEVHSRPSEKRAHKNGVLRMKIEILKAFAVISAAAPSPQQGKAVGDE